MFACPALSPPHLACPFWTAGSFQRQGIFRIFCHPNPRANVCSTVYEHIPNPAQIRRRAACRAAACRRRCRRLRPTKRPGRRRQGRERPDRNGQARDLHR